MKELLSDGQGEYTEKKSRFIGYITRVTSEEEALDVITKKKKEYHDARHNCSAYRIVGENGQILSRFSDDGEPSGTAGKPILEVLEGEELVNCVCVVTRYFGGVLLGTGGLVRSYTQSSKEAFENALVAERQQGYQAHIRCTYNDLGKIEYIIRENGIAVLETKYESDVIMDVMMPMDMRDSIEGKIIEATSANAKMDYEDLSAFAVTDGEVVLL